ncbi:hypothetical protein GLOTRDRAFT_93366 [Gloeophyllum trabeum ATCC 11539]|uniref:Uncharacterized protein n=1 Tax=Gloeophyllum trabeum (strain ATCC 11539 / FP-39264 / Madison 617) TaxID=670483 RepID=S7Q8R4_GLOTA|nr:uncharacterized protein GLOTRDRAFT_93366 [Gloeophyllum trabeum ATCC 11539]EPQ55818.1 hypothetical protein GLOTRDRAFT_93366 [Gloeophyllum trabeum ATCC 11539]
MTAVDFSVVTCDSTDILEVFNHFYLIFWRKYTSAPHGHELRSLCPIKRRVITSELMTRASTYIPELEASGAPSPDRRHQLPQRLACFGRYGRLLGPRARLLTRRLATILLQSGSYCNLAIGLDHQKYCKSETDRKRSHGRNGNRIGVLSWKLLVRARNQPETALDAENCTSINTADGLSIGQGKRWSLKTITRGRQLLMMTYGAFQLAACDRYGQRRWPPTDSRGLDINCVAPPRTVPGVRDHVTDAPAFSCDACDGAWHEAVHFLPATSTDPTIGCLQCSFCGLEHSGRAMWSKLSNALKSSSSKHGRDDDEWEESGLQPPVLDGVFEQHPNLSVFYNNQEEVPFPNASPPASPSKSGRKGLLKRASKMPWSEDSENQSPAKLSLSLPSRLKNSLNLNGSDISLPRGLTDSPRPSQETLRRDSQDSSKPPQTPVDNNKFGSLRSILRDRNTPATGQSVRFFSRDAYKVITPDTSVASEPEPNSFHDRLQQAAPNEPAGSTLRHEIPSSMNDLFSPPKLAPPYPGTPGESSRGLASFAIPTSDLSNIFDISQEHELPTIPVDTEGRLLDEAVEIEDTAETVEGLGSDPVRRSSTPLKHNQSVSFATAKSEHTLDRSKSFSFGQTVFHSVADGNSAESEKSQSFMTAAEKSEARPVSPEGSLAKRGRSMSDTMFQSMLRSTMKSPEADIDDRSEAMVVYAQPEPDPFSTNATTFYSPQANIPPTPPHTTHSRKSSREEDLILSLKTQLSLQQEMCGHYEIDLKARDELVGMLSARLEQADRDAEKRKSALKQWKKKVQELERTCRHLEEEVDNSRQESLERSVMDEASGEALRQLHRQINRLEMEKKEVEKREAIAREEVEKLKADAGAKDDEIKRLTGELEKKEACERALQEGIKAANEQMTMMQRQSYGDDEHELKALVVKREQVNEEEKDRHREIEFAWAEERARLVTRVDQLEVENKEVTGQLDDLRQEVARKEEQLGMLQNELEAQWKNTEEMNDRIQVLTQDRNTLQTEIEVLEERISNMEVDWSQTENRKCELEAEAQEAWNARDEIEREKQQLEDELHAEREHTDGLTQALQEREDRIEDLDRERQYALDTVKRLEDNLRERDTDSTEYSKRVAEREQQIEQLQDELSGLKREHNRIVDEQRRAIDDISSREEQARTSMETMIQQKAEADVALKTLNDRVASLTAEIEKLRRQVHVLQAETSDKDIKIVQLTKQRNKHQEDINGMNIALDSKQQELELLKRRLGVKGTAGATPAAATTKTFHRRESSIPVTPGTSRPSSRLSETTKRGTSQTPSALSKSIRGNRTMDSTSSADSLPASAQKIQGAMGPPLTKPRASAASAGTPTPTQSRLPPSSLKRTSSANPAPATAGPSTLHRRASSVTPASKVARSPSSMSEREDKENATPTARPARKPVAVPA